MNERNSDSRYRGAWGGLTESKGQDRNLNPWTHLTLEPVSTPVCSTASSDKAVPHLGQVWDKMSVFYPHIQAFLYSIFSHSSSQRFDKITRGTIPEIFLTDAQQMWGLCTSFLVKRFVCLILAPGWKDCLKYELSYCFSEKQSGPKTLETTFHGYVFQI